MGVAEALSLKQAPLTKLKSSTKLCLTDNFGGTGLAVKGYMQENQLRHERLTMRCHFHATPSFRKSFPSIWKGIWPAIVISYCLVYKLSLPNSQRKGTRLFVAAKLQMYKHYLELHACSFQDDIGSEQQLQLHVVGTRAVTLNTRKGG